MANPLVPQGTLNRLVASIVFANFTALNITPPFLGPEAIRLTFDGPVTGFIPTMTGAVTSPEPYQKVSIRSQLIKTQGLAQAFKSQIELSSLLGDCTVRPDVAASQGGLGPWSLTNSAIETVEPVELNGAVAWYIINIGAYYIINSALWNG